jgi:hypothetical protein
MPLERSSVLLVVLVGLATISTGESTVRASHANWTGDGHGGYGWYVGDFDGDWDDDIFRQIYDGVGAEVYLSNGTDQFEPDGQWTPASHYGYG